MDYHVKDLSLADEGLRLIEWAEMDMPVLRLIRERFKEEKPLKGVKIGGCLHITTETANLARTLKEGGAEVYLCASNPLSTKDEVAAALVKHFDISVFGSEAEKFINYFKYFFNRDGMCSIGIHIYS